MTQTERPQEKTSKPDPAWPIRFNRQDLLAICNGSGKGADLLYHFLNKSRWEIYNKKLDIKSVKVIIFQEEKSEIIDAIKSSRFGNTISHGSYNTNLRHLRNAGYVLSQPYSTTFEVHLDVIESALANPPQREKKNPAQKSVKVSKCQSVKTGVSREEHQALQETCVNLSKICQSLESQILRLTDMCQPLTQNTTIYAALEAALLAIGTPTNHDFKSNDQKDVFLGVHENNSESQTSSMVQKKYEDLDCLSEDCSEAQPKLRIVSSMSYSQETNQPANEEKVEVTPTSQQLDIIVPAQSPGYKQDKSSSQGSTSSASPSQSKNSGLRIERETEKKKQEERNKPVNGKLFSDNPLSIESDVPQFALTPKQIAKQRADRMEKVMELIDQAAKARVPRGQKKFVKEALEDLIDGDYTDEQIVFSVQDLKARNKDLTYQAIDANMATAVNKLDNHLPPGVLPFPQAQEKPQEPTHMTPGQRKMAELREKRRKFESLGETERSIAQ